MKEAHFVLCVHFALAVVLSACGDTKPQQVQESPEGVTGSLSCRKCHEESYQLWSTSHHGTAMQPFSFVFAKESLTPQKQAIPIGEYLYQAHIAPQTGWVVEQGPQGEKKYPIKHAMGGKNVYYFLTELDRGRIQVLPVAYDVREKSWFDTAASGVRHFPGTSVDSPIHWKDRQYTFNTACYGCHVSQLATNYDPKTDTYSTTWRQSGINCETCHGPAEEHIRVCEAAPQGQVPKDLKIKSAWGNNSVRQTNEACSVCHAKLVPFFGDFQPGDRFFDHFDLVALEHRDFYPDGRDLGENYTFTLWRMSPCARSGELGCLHCHTSSGRYKFEDTGKENEACLPCHKERVEQAAAHTHHKEGSEGNRCVSCHMPMTDFARMRRSDHSMLPPTPRATLEFSSPNACNLCHTDQDASWADKHVRTWHEEDYQAPVLHRATLIEGARKRDFSRLREMTAYIEDKARDEIFATSLIRLLANCEDERKWSAIRKAMSDPSPLVRAAAATAMGYHLEPRDSRYLIEATRDSYRLVRVRAAEALAGLPLNTLAFEDRKSVSDAFSEFESAMRSRSDDFNACYSLANFYLQQGRPKEAVEPFEMALRIEPNNLTPLVNVALAYARVNEPAKAQGSLKRALSIAAKNAPANFNMGLLMAEQGKTTEAEGHFRVALESRPDFPEAAYNLAVLISDSKLEEALEWIHKAHELAPHQPRYAFTEAFYLQKNNDTQRAIEVLEKLLERHPRYMDAHRLLGQLRRGKAPTRR